jgi:hypothetical protein
MLLTIALGFSQQLEGVIDIFLRRRNNNLKRIKKFQLQNDEIDVKLEFMKIHLLTLPAEITECDDKFARKTIKHISVIDEEYLKITFISGSEIKIKMEPRNI